MTFSTTIATRAALIAEPARAQMLAALLDGKARPAGELAQVASITAQTASSHLARLLDAGLVECESQGRHRYYRLSNAEVAEALERLATMVPNARVRVVHPELKFARRCYNHLAGELGVAVTNALCERGYVAPIASKQYAITPAGSAWFAGLNIEVEGLRSSRGVARQCLDWTERIHHLGGPLGVRLLEAMCDLDWLRCSKTSRRLVVTMKGVAELRARLDVKLPLDERRQSA